MSFFAIFGFSQSPKPCKIGRETQREEKLREKGSEVAIASVIAEGGREANLTVTKKGDILFIFLLQITVYSLGLCLCVFSVWPGEEEHCSHHQHSCFGLCRSGHM
jgi:hypothetical protein